MEELCMVYITTSNKDEAVKISRELISSKLAACANIINKALSIYKWEGIIHEEEEFIMILKTKSSLFPALEKKVKDLHSYSCPCIISIPITNSSEEFAEWIEEETTG